MTIKNETIENIMSYGLLLFAFSLCLSVTFTEIGFLVALLAVIVTAYKTNFANLRNIYPAVKIIIIAWIIYFAAGIISSLLGVSPVESLKYIKKDLTRFSAFLALVFAVPYQTDKKIKNIISVYILGAVISSVTGIFQVLIHFLKHGSLIMATGTMHRLFYAELLAVAAGFAVIKAITEKDNRMIHAVSFLLISSALILSQERGPALGFITIMSGLLVLNKHNRKNLVLFFLIFLLPLSVFYAFNSRFKTRWSSISKGAVKVVTGNLPETFENASEIDSATEIRLIMWKTGIKIIKDYPVFGTGPKGLKKLFYKYYSPPDERKKDSWSNLHNLYLHQAVERGLFGLFALMFLLFSILFKSFQFFKKTHSEYSVSAVSITCGFLVMNLTQTSFQHAVISMSVFFIFSLGLREALNHDNLNSEHRP